MKERTSAGISRGVLGRVAACWLTAIAVLAWLQFAEMHGTAGRVVRVIPTCLLAPIVFPWCTLLPWPLAGWHAEGLADFVLALLSLMLLLAYAIRPNRATAGLSIGGAVWWVWIACLDLSR